MEKHSERDSEAKQGVETITVEKFQIMDFEAPIAKSITVDCWNLGSLYQSAISNEKEVGNQVAVSIFQLLEAVCGMDFKPYDSAEPYGPKAVINSKRTLIPSDLKGEQSIVFSEIASDIRNPGLRARLADIAWINDRKLADSARLAIDAYCQAIQMVLDGKAELYDKEESTSSSIGCDMLRRACQIAKAIGWKKPEGSNLKSLIKVVTSDAFNRKDHRGFLEIGEVSLDHGIENPATLAENAESMAVSENKDSYDSRYLWKLAAHGYKLAQKKEEYYRCLASAAECYVTMASADDFKGMIAASCLMDAIKELRNIPNTKERRQELKIKLLGAQSYINDEMGVISNEVDLTNIADDARKRVAGLTLSQALAQFADLERSPDIAKLREDVQKQAEDNPLSSMIPRSTHDDEGKVVVKSPGLPIGEEDDVAIHHRICQNEAWRRQVVVVGSIEPARRLIHSEHPLDQRHFQPIVSRNPLIPGDHEYLFALGFLRFFSGDFISALHILVPQLENSLRYVLKQAGVDPSSIQSNMTQENRTLSTILEKDRGTLERIFGPDILFEIENIFDFRGGPVIRHELAHGLVSVAECYAPNSIYACWFIFRLCCLPLFSDWQKITNELNKI